MMLHKRCPYLEQRWPLGVGLTKSEPKTERHKTRKTRKTLRLTPMILPSVSRILTISLAQAEIHMMATANPIYANAACSFGGLASFVVSHTITARMHPMMSRSSHTKKSPATATIPAGVGKQQRKDEGQLRRRRWPQRPKRGHRGWLDVMPCTCRMKRQTSSPSVTMGIDVFARCVHAPSSDAKANPRRPKMQCIVLSGRFQRWSSSS